MTAKIADAGDRGAHLYSEGILAMRDDVRHVKFGREAAVLAVSQELAIQPDIYCIIHSLEVEGDPACRFARLRIPSSVT